ncbi:MAG: TonB family protein, partial [Deltaproteobacteria bacterium]|nr:TonB family protein [Deltaproteobacteria bacterium]
FLFSISFHALVLILLLLFGGTTPPPPPPTTQVTMIRLSRGSGDVNAPLFSRPAPAEKPGVSQPAAAPIPVAKPAPIEPVPPVKPNVPVKPSAPAKPPTPTAPKENAQVVHVGKEKEKPTPQKPNPKANPTTTTSSTAKPTAKPSPPTANDQQMSQALANIQNELKDRDSQAQQQRTNEASSGGIPGGDAQGHVPAFGNPNGEITGADPGYAQYQSSVRGKIIREWVRTGASPDGEQAIRTRIQVRINASGQVISKSVVKSSGDESFDLSALRAIERASPLPPPPEGIKSEALSEGFVVDFSSRMLGRK